MRPLDSSEKLGVGGTSLEFQNYESLWKSVTDSMEQEVYLERPGRASNCSAYENPGHFP